jgi:hypothetical protein
MNFENHESGLEQEMNSGWEKSLNNRFIKSLQEGSNLQDLLNEELEKKEFFEELDTIDCSDGRVLSGKKIGIAGSGLLLPPEERKAFIEAYKGKIKAVSTHFDCGAAKAAFTSLTKDELPEGISTSDEYGTYVGKETAEALGAEHIYLDEEELANNYHNEMALVVDQSGKFNPDNIEDFPPHFLCSGAGFSLSPEYMGKEIAMLSGIALGGHGFGQRFNNGNPFRIMIIANNEEEKTRWQEIAEKAVNDFGDRVKIETFVRKD